MANLGFYLLELFEESQHKGERFILPTAESFNDIPETFHTLVDDTYYEVFVENNNDYIWFSFDFGSPSPRDENLTNINTGKKKNNPRENSETELLKQLFCLYHYHKNILYLSNSKKQGLIQTVLKEKVGTDFITKNFYKTQEEFISLIKSIDKISFTEAHNLFNFNSKERKALVDLTGTDAPEQFTIEAKYPTSYRPIDFIKKLLGAKKSYSLKDLLICGTDEDDFSFIFNDDTFNRKIEVKCKKDENGKYPSDLVLQDLLKEINR